MAKRKFLATVAMVLVALLSLTVVTYAWFTTTRIVTASGMQLSAKARGSLVVCAQSDGTYAKDISLNFNDMNFVPTSGELTTIGNVEPIVGADFVGEGKQTNLFGTAGGNSTNVYTKITNSVAQGLVNQYYNYRQDSLSYEKPPYLYYFDFDLYFKLDSKLATGEGVDIFLETLSIVATNEDDSEKKLGNAFRVAVYEYESYSASPLVEGTPILRGTYANMLGLTETDADLTTWQPIKTLNANGNCTEFGITQTAKRTGSVGESAVKLNKTTITGDGDIVKLKFRVWLEGQDDFCTRSNAAECELSMDFNGRDNLL